MLTKRSDFERNVGKKVKFQGKISDIMWQHFTIKTGEHPYMKYIDVNETFQIVVYSKQEITCKTNIELTGELIKVGNKGNDPRYKIHDEFFEYQLIADSWKCI
ncbi:MAG: hypothetical protein KGD73_09575 [Candidatus Lokiarchaeota archaeon]|nr:hypothetical protein [Candidatus Lokiarchaeota archaeon]